jgi:hypothetical protein
MWFTVELPRPAAVTEVQFDSAVSAGRRRIGARRRLPARLQPAGVSTDGTTWSQPVAEGKGGGPRTVILVAPIRAKFVRLTQTGSDRCSGMVDQESAGLRGAGKYNEEVVSFQFQFSELATATDWELVTGDW